MKAVKTYCYCSLVCFYSAGDWTKGLVLTRQALCHWVTFLPNTVIVIVKISHLLCTEDWFPYLLPFYWFPLAFCSFQTRYHLIQRLNSFMKCVPYGKGLKAGKDKYVHKSKAWVIYRYNVVKLLISVVSLMGLTREMDFWACLCGTVSVTLSEMVL